MDAQLAFIHSAQVVAMVLALRCFPVVVAFCASQSPRWWERLLVLLIYGLVACAAMSLGAFAGLQLLEAYLYLTLVASAVYVLRPLHKLPLLLLPSTIILFMVLPAIATGQANTIALVIGFDVALSVYSYCVTPKKTQSFAGFSRFVLVNPSLVYSRRGTVVSAAGLNAAGLARLAVGALSIFVAELTPFGLRLALPAFDAGPPATLESTLKLLQFYLAHTGLASLQIGLCRQLGWQLPERYAQPFRARSPLEFWRRWNTYVGAWVRIHLFRPLALRGGKWGFHGHAWVATVVLLSFIYVGLLHDIGVSFQRGALHWRWLAWFVANGILVVGWEAIARALRRRRARRDVPALAAHAAVYAIAIFMAGHVQ